MTARKRAQKSNRKAGQTAGKRRGKRGPGRPPAADPDLVTRRELARRMGVHPMSVTRWERDGLPIAVRGSAGVPSKYRETEARTWLELRRQAAVSEGGTVDLVRERARKERAQAVLAEQSYSIRMRDLLPREEVERVWSGEIAAVRTKLMSWSTTLADQVHRVSAIEGVAGVERALAAAVRDVLRELSSPDRPLPESEPPGNGKAAEAA